MRFSQVFLNDKIIIEKILNLLEINQGDVFLEVGPGKGQITSHLISKGAIVYAIEIDYELIKLLKERFYLILDKKLFLIYGDFLKLELNFLPTVKFFSNLPYHITSQALFKIINNKKKFSVVYIMLQMEVAQKIIKSDNYLGAIINYHFQVENLLNVPPSAFIPKPSVFSSFLKLTPRYMNFEKTFENFLFKIMRQSYFQKRKKIKNILRNLTIPDELVDKRPQELNFYDFIKIAQINFKRKL